MTAGSYAGATLGFPVGAGVGLYIDSRGRAYPQLYGGSPGFSISGGYTPDLEGLLTGPSVSWSPGVGAIRYNVGGNTDTIGAGVGTATVGTPSIGVTHGFGPLEASKDYSKPWMIPAIRESAARAGVPSRYNVFEYGYPDANVGSPTFDKRWNGAEQPASGAAASTAPEPNQARGLAAMLMDRIRQMNERDANKPPTFVFDTGAQAVPFIPDDGEEMFFDQSGDRLPIRKLSRIDRR